MFYVHVFDIYNVIFFFFFNKREKRRFVDDDDASKIAKSFRIATTKMIDVMIVENF